jgi:anti-anti-sigma regulatory factor
MEAAMLARTVSPAQGDVQLIRIVGHLEVIADARINAFLRAEGRESGLILDLTGMAEAESDSLDVIRGLIGRARQRGGQVVVVTPDPITANAVACATAGSVPLTASVMDAARWLGRHGGRRSGLLPLAL